FRRWQAARLLGATIGARSAVQPLLEPLLAALGGAQLGTPFLAPLLDALVALAADRLEEAVEIVAAVVVGDLVTRLDVPDRADDHHAALAALGARAADDVGFGVRPTGMVGVACDVAAARSVHGPAAVELVHVARAACLQEIRHLVGDAAALVFGDDG